MTVYFPTDKVLDIVKGNYTTVKKKFKKMVDPMKAFSFSPSNDKESFHL